MFFCFHPSGVGKASKNNTTPIHCNYIANYYYLHNTAVDCGSLDDPVNGQVEFTNTTVGSTANYTCNCGYFLSNGNSTRTCEANGEWSGSPPSCECEWTCRNIIDNCMHLSSLELLTVAQWCSTIVSKHILNCIVTIRHLWVRAVT